MVVEQRDDLEPGKGQVLIDVRGAGVNFPDILTVEGKYQFKPPLPFIPGTEVSGVISKVGEGVTSRSIGDEVIGTTQQGAFADQIVTSEHSTFLKGNRMSFE